MVKGSVGVGIIFNGTSVFIWNFLGMGTWGTGNCTFYIEYGRKVDWREGGSKYYFNEIT